MSAVRNKAVELFPRHARNWIDAVVLLLEACNTRWQHYTLCWHTEILLAIQIDMDDCTAIEEVMTVIDVATDCRQART